MILDFDPLILHYNLWILLSTSLWLGSNSIVNYSHLFFSSDHVIFQIVLWLKWVAKTVRNVRNKYYTIAVVFINWLWFLTFSSFYFFLSDIFGYHICCENPILHISNVFQVFLIEIWNSHHQTRRNLPQTVCLFSLLLLHPKQMKEWK